MNELEKAFARRRSAPPVETPAKVEPPAESPNELQKALSHLGDPRNSSPAVKQAAPDISDGTGFDSPAAAFDRIVASP